MSFRSINPVRYAAAPMNVVGEALFGGPPKEGLVVGIRSMLGNPYNGHTADSQIKHIQILNGMTP